MSKIRELEVSEGFIREHLRSIVQDKQMSFYLRKLSLYTLIEFELGLDKNQRDLGIRSLKANLEQFTEQEQKLIIGEMSTWKRSNQEYKQKFIAEISMMLLTDVSIHELTNLLFRSFYSKIFNKSKLLIEAAGVNRVDVVKLLIKNGTNVNTLDLDGSGKTTLHFFSQRGDEKIVKLLLEAGAKVEIQDSYGNTALHEASKAGHEKIVQLLLEAIDGKKYTMKFNIFKSKLYLLPYTIVDLQNRYGKTALHEASEAGHEKIEQLLLEAGAMKYPYRKTLKPNTISLTWP